MSNNEIKFVTAKGETVTALLKPFISAKMIVEITKIYRKYTAKYDAFVGMWQDADEKTLADLSDADFIRSKKFSEIAVARADVAERLMQEYKQETANITDKKQLAAIAKDYNARISLMQQKASSEFDNMFMLFADEINVEMIPLLVDRSSFVSVSADSADEIVKMLDNPKSELWKEQNVYSFRSICNDVRQKI